MRLLTEPSLWSAGASVGLSSALQMDFTVCLCFLSASAVSWNSCVASFLWLTQTHATLHSWYHLGSGDVSCAGDSYWTTVKKLRLRKSWGTNQRKPHPVFMVVQVSVTS